MKTKRRNKGKTSIVLPVMAVIILVAFIMFMVIRPTGSNNNDSASKTATVPEFRHDGSLQFYANNGKDTVEIAIEVVDSQAEITRGLMYRPQMPANSGMLFIFPGEEVRSFWMKNTYISLDILFVDSNKEIVTIQANTQPLSTEPVPSYKPAKYVIEVNAGFCSKYNIKQGDRISYALRIEN
jgi:uncharacterized membrane protein (UPF0127 family)